MDTGRGHFEPMTDEMLDKLGIKKEKFDPKNARPHFRFRMRIKQDSY